MNIYELRKTASKNKKYKYIYELIIEGEIVVTRRTSKEYSGIWIEQAPKFGRYHWFQSPTIIPFAKLQSGTTDLALTFDELVKYKNLSV